MKSIAKRQDKHRQYAAKWRYMVWLVIAAGWIFPFRPQIDLSFLPVQMSGIPVTPMQPIISAIPPMAGAGDTVNTPATISLWWVLAAIWFLGIISIVLYHALRHARFMKMVRRWSEPVTNSKHLGILDSLKSILGIKTQIGLSVCQSISSPMLVGFFKPSILLPPIRFADDELSLILKHELIHFQRHDLWCKALILTATALHWFNPIVYLMAKAAAVQCEISCDARVLQGADFQQRKQYGETIIGAVRNGAKHRTALSTNFYGGKNGMKKRLIDIMDTKKKKAGVAILCIILIGTMGTGMALAANKDRSSGAYSTNTSMSPEEQEKISQQNNEQLAKKYAVYAEYGLTYDQNVDSFYYNGKLVRYFSDKLDANGHYNSFTRPNGVVDLKAVRNTSYELTGITPVSQEEYDKRTESIKKAQAANTQGAAQENGSVNKTSGSSSTVEAGETANTINGSTTAYSEGDPSYVDDALSAYLNYGVSYDKVNKQWLFNNKPIHYLSDGDIATYVDDSQNATKYGVSLDVVRSANGQIDKLVEISK